MPSFQLVSQPDHMMIQVETTNAAGENTSPRAAGTAAPGRAAACGRRRTTSGAPAYISTEALVISPTRDCQLGNGRKQMQPARKRDQHPDPRDAARW